MYSLAYNNETQRPAKIKDTSERFKLTVLFDSTVDSQHDCHTVNQHAFMTCSSVLVFSTHDMIARLEYCIK